VNYIVNYIKKEYDGGVLVAQSLEKKKQIDFEDQMPNLKRSTLENADKAKLQNKMFNMIFKQDIADFNKWKMEYERNIKCPVMGEMYKIYATQDLSKKKL
jgi:hypothetical protein